LACFDPDQTPVELAYSPEAAATLRRRAVAVLMGGRRANGRSSVPLPLSSGGYTGNLSNCPNSRPRVLG
jgi:hypothetical protein